MYVDAHLLNDRIWVTTRDQNHKRVVESRTPHHVFYFADANGDYESIYGEKVARSYHTTRRSFYNSIEAKKKQGIDLFETDYNVTFRYLEETFKTDELPPLHSTFFDIEVNVDKSKGGFPKPENPYGAISALTVHHAWQDRTYTLVVPPNGYTVESLRTLFETPNDDGFGIMDETEGYYVCKDEAELLEIFVELIEDTDLLLGWNSDGFDLPYIIHRARMVFGREFPEQFLLEEGNREAPFSPKGNGAEYLKRLCLFPCLPTLTMKEVSNKFSKFRTLEKRYYLHGRAHLDYMDMFKKFTLNTIGKLHSYSLDFVLRSQVGFQKLEYDGTLQQLYETNPRRYAAYNRQDTIGVAKIDEKFKLVDVANELAHMAGVTLDKTLGSTTIIEHAIMRQVVHKQKRVRRNRPERTETHERIPGAFVVEPKGGIYDLIGSIDVQSLYPSAARMINLSPETMFGQFLPTLTSPAWNKLYAEYGGLTSKDKDKAATQAWNHFTAALEFEEIHKRSDVELTLALMDDTEITQTAAEWYDWIVESGFSLSANATLFTQERRGVFAASIDLWFDERLKAKAKASSFAKRAKQETDVIRKAELDIEFARWNTKQMAFKIFMNSAYGASASRFFIFYDPRLGKSITLSGRVITKHMVRQVCKDTSGNYDFDRNVLIYGDTDSCYFKLDWYMKEKLGMIPKPGDMLPKTPFMDKVIGIADDLTTKVNATFPDLLRDNFFCNEKNRTYILAVRDVVAIRGLFKEQKKKYALWAVMQEDKPTDEVKIVGMETKRTNTPKYMQKFLENLITRILKENLGYDDTYAIVEKFRNEEFKVMDPWKHGSSMSIKNIGQIGQAMDEYDRMTEAGHVGLKKPTGSYAIPAALNTNKLIEMYGEDRWDIIREGDSVETLYLLPNENDFKSVALPVGATYIPEWFKQLPFDTRRNQDKILENALENTVGEVLDWDLTPKQNNAAEVFVEEDFFA